MMQDLFVPFFTILLAELGDKTQLAVLTLSTKTKKYFQLLIGVILAFVLADGLAIIFGDFIKAHVPLFYIKIIAGMIFLVFGVLTLMNKDEGSENISMKQPFITGFSLVFISELGDKTQIASALFATQFNPWLVFLGVMLSLSLLSVLAIYLGNVISKRINKKTIAIIAGCLFLIIGVWSIISAFLG